MRPKVSVDDFLVDFWYQNTKLNDSPGMLFSYSLQSNTLPENNRFSFSPTNYNAILKSQAYTEASIH